MAVILGNPVMIAAYQAGIRGDGKPFPDGAGMAGQQTLRGQRRVGLRRVRLRCRDRHVQARHRGELAAAGHDARCGFGCHTIVKARDYVFTEFAHR